MTIREFIKEKMNKIFTELHVQLSEQRNLKSRLLVELEQLGNTDNEYGEYFQNLIESLENESKKLMKSRDFVKSLSNTAEELQITSEKNKIRGYRKNNIIESNFKEVNGALKVVHRETTVDGKKYSFYETKVGEKYKKGYVKTVEGFENGEQTYYNIESEGGSSIETKRYLAYSKGIIGVTHEGLQLYGDKREPEKDTIITKTLDFENGETVSQESALCDTKGKKIGTYSQVQKQNIASFDSEEAKKRSTVIERKFVGKDGNEVIFKSVIENTGNGIHKRKDYQNGELVTEAIMNEDQDWMRVTNFKEGKKVNSSYFDSFDENGWQLNEEKSFVFDEDGDKKKSDEITTEDKMLYSVSNPSYVSTKEDESRQKNAIFYEQTSFLKGVYMSEELENFMEISSFAQGVNYSSAEHILNDSAIEELKEKQQQIDHRNLQENKERD